MGDIIQIFARIKEVRRSSVTAEGKAVAYDPEKQTSREIIACEVTYVAVGANGRPVRIFDRSKPGVVISFLTTPRADPVQFRRLQALVNLFRSLPASRCLPVLAAPIFDSSAAKSPVESPIALKASCETITKWLPCVRPLSETIVYSLPKFSLPRCISWQLLR